MTKDMKPSQIDTWANQEFNKSLDNPNSRLQQERQFLAVANAVGLAEHTPNSIEAHRRLCGLLEDWITA
jgi:hypothetical protein